MAIPYEKRKEYYSSEEFKARRKALRDARREIVREQNLASWHKNKDKYLAKAKKSYYENHEERKQKMREYYHEHKDSEK